MSKKMKGSALGGDCGADCIGRMLLNPATDFSAGALRSSWPRRTATRPWSSSSSPPAPPSTSKKTTGRNVGPSSLALRCQPTAHGTSLGRQTALFEAAFEGHTLVVEQLITAGAALDVEENDR
jgi:hypothetical protein